MGGRGPGRFAQTKRIRSVNGVDVPVETVEERVLEEGPGGRVIERLIRWFDQNGQPTQREKVRVEERREGGWAVTTATVWREDLNGRPVFAERSRTEAVRSGDVTRSTMVIERPAVDGSVAAVERQVKTETSREGHTRREVEIYRPDPGGSFRAAARETAEIVEQNGRRVETVTRYDTVNATGRMEFSGLTEAETVRREDGSELTVVSLFGAAAPGRPIESRRGRHLREQVLIERRPGPGGSVIERTSVRRTSLSDPGKLEAAQPVSETICTGDCAEPAAEAGGNR